MSRDEILAALRGVFREVFDDAAIEISPETTADDIEGWDSLMHIQLVTSVEAHFSVKFKLREIMKFNDVGDLCDSIEKHKA
jgi:acyl carrier protein